MRKFQLIIKSQLNDSDYTSLFKNNLENDRYSNYTCCGIHKDDLIFKIHGKSIKKFGESRSTRNFCNCPKDSSI